MKHMKEVIDRYKQENGNAGFTQKDMLFYLVSRVDAINEKINKGAGKISANRESIVMMKWTFGAIGTILGLAITVFAAMR